MPRATPDGMKVCSKCKENKKVEEFGKHKGEEDGRQWHCKSCVKQAAHLYYTRTKEVQNAKSMLWVKNNPEKAREARLRYYEKNKEKLKKRSRDWYAANIEKAREANKRSYFKNQETCQARTNLWRANNKERCRESRLAWGRSNKDKLKAQNLRVREKLTDGVVASILGFKVSCVPPELIELKRLQIQIKRELKQQEQCK